MKTKNNPKSKKISKSESAPVATSDSSKQTKQVTGGLKEAVKRGDITARQALDMPIERSKLSNNPGDKLALNTDAARWLRRRLNN